ncbi:hypothetical protein Ttaiw_00497 [Tepidimonas taiwanensis]|uniref:Uncharacterized protein n=1 Tax=Tepidimonas taiwanensis TaxID=307486 RepID=A0A554XCM4_9BURK|nr:hypothetical protein Ttaiw_00497 [Tepidimonas taiwanensis]
MVFPGAAHGLLAPKVGSGGTASGQFPAPGRAPAFRETVAQVAHGPPSVAGGTRIMCDTQPQCAQKAPKGPERGQKRAAEGPKSVLTCSKPSAAAEKSGFGADFFNSLVNHLIARVRRQLCLLRLRHVTPPNFTCPKTPLKPPCNLFWRVEKPCSTVGARMNFHVRLPHLFVNRNPRRSAGITSCLRTPHRLRVSLFVPIVASTQIIIPYPKLERNNENYKRNEERKEIILAQDFLQY